MAIGSIAKFLMQAGSGLGRQGLARVLPTGEERVLQGLRSYGERMFDPANAMGVTVDLRTGRNLVPGEQAGYMMSRIPNPADQSNVVRNVDDLINYTQNNPAVMRELQTGGYAGGWFDKKLGGFVFDPARRYLTKGGAMRAGVKSDQKAGFDMLRGAEFPVENTAPRQILGAGAPLARILTGSGIGSVAGGATGVGAAMEDGQLTMQDAPSILGATALGGLAGGLMGSRTGLQNRGVIAPAQLRKMRSLGVPESPEGGIGMSGRVARERARSLGVPDELISDIKDTDNEVVAFRKAYNAAFQTFGKIFNRISSDELKSAKAALEQAAGSVAVPRSRTLANNLRAKFGTGQPAQPVTPGTKPQPVVLSTVDDKFKNMGLRQVRHATNSKEMAKLAKDGDTAKLIETSEDVIHNLSRFVTQADLEDIVRRKGVPIFYILHNLSTRARSAALGVPMLRMLGVQAPASARNAPIPEVTFSNYALMRGQVDEAVASGVLRDAPPFPSWKNYAKEDVTGLRTDSKKYKEIQAAAKQDPEYKRLVKERDEAIKAGALINRGQMANKPSASLEAIENDIISFMRNPISVPNIAEKVWTYMGTTGSPFQKVVSTMDSWMMRAAFGNSKLGTATPGKAGNISLEYQVMHEAMNDLARRLGVPPAALQEVIWKNVRVAAENAGESFLPLDARRWLYPNLSESAKQVPEGMKSVFEVSRTKEFKEANKRFVGKLLKALEEDPSMARFFNIVGDDIEFTDEFFANLGLF